MAKTRVTELPPDNSARIAIFDDLCEFGGSARTKHRVIPTDQLFERVIGRLRILVPRELHLAGDRPYFDEKLRVCIEADIACSADGGVALGDEAPFIQYPDGKIRQYPAGLQAARTRLERDDATLRRANFDVRKLVPSLADARRSPAFRALVTSMREHGYLKQFPIVRGADGELIDGRARIAAAAVAGVTAVESKEEERPPNRLDTPLHRVVLLVAVNASRMIDEDRARVLDAVTETTGRLWTEIESDLVLTREWRRAIRRPYVAFFEVEEVPFRPGESELNIPITLDGPVRVGIRKLVEVAGMSNYKIQEELRGHVIEERARTQLTSRPAIFVEISNAIDGIEAMQAQRRTKKLKLDPQWEVARNWLIDQSRARASRAKAADEAAESLQSADQPV